MAFKMLLRFTGLCAFVPDLPINQGNNEATVVLVNARHSHRAPHRAVFLAAPEHFANGNQRHISNPLLHEGVRRRACPLVGEEFTIVGRDANGQPVQPAAHALTFLTGLRPNPPEPCPDFDVRLDDPDFSWVCQNRGTLNPAVLTSTALGDLIAARVKLTQGTLKTGGFRVINNNQVVRFKFGAEDSQAFPEEVVWDFDFTDASRVVDVMLVSAPFDNFPQNPPLILKPRADTELLEGFIVNIPVENLFLLDPPLPLADDDHYEEYYRLCQGVPPTTIPIPDRQIFCPGPAGATNPKCPPTYF